MTVTTTRARAALRRGWPRAVRLADRGVRNIGGSLVAVVLAVWLWGRPVVIATVANPQPALALRALAQGLRRVKVTLAGLGTLALGLLFGLDWIVGWVFALPGFAWAGARGAMAVYPLTTRGRVRSRYGVEGFLGVWEWWRHLSPHAAREVAAETRPVLAAALPTVDENAGVGAVAGQRAARAVAVERLAVERCGTWVGRTAVGPLLGLPCWVPLRDTVGIVAAPQSMKTAWLAGRVLDHPGAVVTASTKPDVLGLTGARRASRARSRRIEVFDPEGLSEGGSTFRWDLVRDCECAAVAAERAAALVAASASAGGDDDKVWADAAARVLRSLLAAAALDGLSMREVYTWATSAAKADDALALLEGKHKDHAPPGWAGELRQLVHTDAKRTRDSVWFTLSGAVAFMADANVAELCCPAADEPVFDVAAFLRDEGTLYLLGSEREHSPVAPLLAVLTSHIFEQAKRLAARLPKGRLDPPLLLALDEVALIVPVDLPRWLADSGGRGITTIWSTQSVSQLAEKWGPRGAETIWNSTNAKLIPGGLTVVADLETVSKLAGERFDLVPDPAGNGRDRFDRVPVLTPERVRTVPRWHAVLISRSAPVTVVRIVPLWQRADIRKASPPPVVRPIRDVVAEQYDREPATGPIPVQASAAA